MPDDGLTTILRRLDTAHQPDPAFASELFTTLRPLALEAGRRDATVVGRLLGAVVGPAAIGPVARPSRPMRLALIGVIIALGIALFAAFIGRAPARPFIHSTSFGHFMIELDGDIATVTDLQRVAAASPSGSYVLVDLGEPSGSDMVMVAMATREAQPLPPERGDVSAAWSTDDRLAWAVRPFDSVGPPVALHFVRPGQDAILTWQVPPGPGPDPIGIQSFHWSPDGRQLAVATGPDGLADSLYVVDAATATGRDLGDGLNVDDIAWSPEGRSIATTLSGTNDATMNDYELVEIDVTSGERTPLGRADPEVVWSKDGGLFVTAQGSIWQVDPVQAGRRHVALMPDPIGSRLFPSPDGSTLAIMGTGDVPSLWSVPSAGGVPRLVAHGLWYRWRPSWSPDGRWILFTRGPVGARSLWMVRPDGTGLQEIIAPGPREVPGPTLLTAP